MIAILLMQVGFVYLIKGADPLVDGASAPVRGSGGSDLTIGLTVVGFATSATELVVKVLTGFEQTATLAIGNAVGSNPFKIFVVLGISALTRPLPFQPRSNLDVGMDLLGSLRLFSSCSAAAVCGSIAGRAVDFSLSISSASACLPLVHKHLLDVEVYA